MEGWVWLHRKIKNWEWYTDANVSRVFIHLLLSANHEEGRWRGQEVKRGQLITGRKSLALDLKLSERNIRTALSKLKSTNEITIKTTNRFSVITINNFDGYNSSANKPTNNRPTSDQQVTTNNNDNNNNNDNKEKENPLTKKEFSSIKSLTKPILLEIASKYDIPVAFVEDVKESLELYCQSKGKHYKDYRAALMSWVRRDKASYLLKAKRGSKSRGGVVDARNL